MGLAEACKNGSGMDAGEPCFADAQEDRSATSAAMSAASSEACSEASSEACSEACSEASLTDSFNTESAASTTCIDDEEFCNGPLNAEEYIAQVQYWTALRSRA